MNRKSWKSILTVLIVAFTLTGAYAQEQRPAKKAKASNQSIAPLAASSVIGNGTPGRITKWTGVSGSSTYTIGDSNIFEDKYGKVGVGTTTPTSLLTVQGMIETTLGGYKFPDGTVQTTAGIAFVIHDASLMGDGRSATPLGLALGGVQTVHLANSAVTAPKIANGTVVRNLNGLFDNVSLAAGSNITITPAGNTLTIASPNSLTSVAHDATLAGSGTGAAPLGVANGGIGTAQLHDNAVTFAKIAPGQVITSLNNLTDNVTLAAGSNITITPSGNTMTIAGAAGSSKAYHIESGDENLTGGRDIMSKGVPAGSYLILSTILVENLDFDSQEVECELNAGLLDQQRLWLGLIGDPGSKGVFSLHAAVVFASPATIKVRCTGFNVFGIGRLTALSVDSIQ